MSTLIRIIGVGIVGGILALTIRKDKPEFAMLTVLAASVYIMLVTADAMMGIIDELKSVTEQCGIDMKYITVTVKTVGIAYISQFAAEILRDSGEGAIASRIEMAGKITILTLTMPVMVSFLELCIRVVNSV